MDPVLFISLVILAITQMIKMAAPNVQGWLTIIVAFIVGILIALFSEALGLAGLTIAEGIYAALGAIGISSAASKAGGGAHGDNHVH